jgi:hypothetical protein
MERTKPVTISGVFARSGPAKLAVVGVAVVALLAPSAVGVVGQTSQPATTQNLLPSTTVPQSQQTLEQPVLEDEEEVGSSAEESPLEAVRITIGGPVGQYPSENEGAFVFTARAGQSIRITSSRVWSLLGPDGSTVNEGSESVSPRVDLVDSGRYVLQVAKGLTAPAKVQLIAANPLAIVRFSTVGSDITITNPEARTEVVQVSVRGGQRYRLTVSPPAQVCADDAAGPDVDSVLCVTSSNAASSETFVVDRDLQLSLTGSGVSGQVSFRIDEAPNDFIVDTTKNPAVDVTPLPGQRAVIPFWGSPAERAVISSPTESSVSNWGQPWIDRETIGSERVKVFAVPVVFDPKNLPFVAWTGVKGDTEAERIEKSRRQYGVYRGEDTPADVATTGEPVVITNRAWFAAVASLQFQPGQRYAIQVTGKNIRPVSVALRDPSGKFTSNLSPWQWTESGGEQRAITTVTADREGRWALELRPAGNNVRDMSVSVVRVGGGGSYEGAVIVDDVLTIGEATDVQLGPNEFAKLTVKLNSATPQLMQPEVLRFRNRTFQPSAVDMSVWDSRGRLVWSNNRNLDEEVLSGRLGKETQLSELFATVSSAEPYTVIIDPKVDLAGRFRVSVKSTPVVTDVAIGNGTIPVVLGGTLTGVVEVRQPTRYRLGGASGCFSASSFEGWEESGPCLANGQSITLHPGVHRLKFDRPVTTAASFAQVPAGTGPDPVVTIEASLTGNEVSVPSLTQVFIRFPAGAGQRVSIYEVDRSNKDAPFSLASPTIVFPDGSRTYASGAFVAPVSGVYGFWVTNPSQGPRVFSIRPSPAEVVGGTLSLGAASKQVTVLPGQRFEATVRLSTRTRVGFNLFNTQFLYAADTKERRFTADGSAGVVLAPGTYRFVFFGGGKGRIALFRLPIKLE